MKQYITDNWKAITIYAITLIYFIVMMDFYQYRVARFPDESSHIAYIAYLEETGEFIPNFYEMPLQVSIDNTNKLTFTTNGTNYLGHPPLYYHLMRLSSGIEKIGEDIYVDIQQLRDDAQIISILGLVLAFYIGLTRLDKTIYHLLYATIVTSVPMMAYNSAGISNDALVFIGVNITLLSLLRIIEGKKDLATYILLVIGVCGGILAKLTGGLILVVACIMTFLYKIIKDRSLEIVFNKNFLITIPLYILTVGYFIYLIRIYGAVQPRLASLDPDYFIVSGFYTLVDERVTLDLPAYISRFMNLFLVTWTGIASHVSLVKIGSLIGITRIGVITVLFLPILGVVKFSKEKVVLLGMYLGVWVGVAYQIYTMYGEHIDNGYMGGYQSRYYLSALPAMALLICYIIRDRWQFWVTKYNMYIVNGVGYLITLSFVGLLIYENFVYFLLHFVDYIY